MAGQSSVKFKWTVYRTGGNINIDDIQFTADPAPTCGVEVNVEPPSQEGWPSQVLEFTINVHNSGTVVDNIILSYIPDGWPDISIDPPVLIDVAPCEWRQATLYVHVPDGALPSTYKEIIVIAESELCQATDDAVVTVHVTEAPPVCGVDVNIEPKSQEGPPSTVLEYTINVHNSGTVVDNIILSFVPDGWLDITIDPPVLIDVAPCETRQATLFVHVPDGAEPSTYKDITVIAESEFCHVTDEDTATAHVTEAPPVCGVEVNVEPPIQEGWPSQVLEFTISVHNSGNIVDTIILSFVQDGWPDITIDPTVLIDVAPCETRQATLYVHVPDGAEPSTYKEIIVIAESEFCHATDSDSAQVHVVEVPVPWTGTAAFSLVNLYTVNVEKILDLNLGSKLVVKFYDYSDAYENENVIETFSELPWNVTDNELARHPGVGGEWKGAKIARLDLTTDNTENVISTIASYTVRRVDLETRFSRIPGEWFLAPPPERTELETEFSRIPSAWFLAPS